MEERKKHPSFPSNYLTLAQLQERWLKQQNQINQPQPQPQPQEQHNHHHRQQPHQEQVLVPRNGNAYRSRPQLQYVAKNRNDSETRRRATKVAVASDDNCKSEAVAGIGDETADLNGKSSESKKNQNNRRNGKGKWKTKTEKRGARGDGSGTGAQGKEEAEKKATIEKKNELEKNGGSASVDEVGQRVRVLSINSGDEKKKKKKKNGGSVTAEEVVEQSVRILSINSENGKQNNGRLGKMNNGFGTAAHGKKEAEKTTIENELKEKKNGGSVTVEEVEQRVRVSSKNEEEEKKNGGSVTVEEMEKRVGVSSSNNSGNGKQNGRLGKMSNSFRHSESQRKYYGGEASYGYGYGNRGNGHYSKVGVQKTTEKKMVWVKKDEIVGEALLLGFQHYLLTLSITVLIPTILVPQMGGGDAEKARVIQTLLLASGISTFLQSLLGTRLPIVVVGSYTYIIPIISIIQANRYKSYTDPYEVKRFTQTMRGIQGALITTSCFQMAVGFFGLWRNAVRFLRPLCVVPYVTFTGLSLYRLGFPMYLNRYMSTKKPIYDRYSVLFTISSAWLFALVLTSCTAYNHKPQSTQNSCRTDRAGLISAAPWVYFPRFFQWGSPTFNAGEAFAMMAASFVSLFEYTGTCYAAVRYGSATPVPPSVISRGAGWMVVSTLLSGKFGSITGCTASVENAGLLALTKAGSRRVV
ncbi:putative nucleobase-ascorbate transporter 10 [Glycine soja]|uniref:Putative nucleobase-ascorbate transporter 10 n=1 Tax=Glycine soja TaxID=3848 RepID=A0A445GAY7_GLYSO|nr:putative nucleobase-ascorbate transporter 10 [Glycine soja]